MESVASDLKFSEAGPAATSDVVNAGTAAGSPPAAPVGRGRTTIDIDTNRNKPTIIYTCFTMMFFSSALPSVVESVEFEIILQVQSPETFGNSSCSSEFSL
jgi:hypothetical protein